MRTLREIRAERLFTMRDLAEKSGVALSTIYLVENGKTTPRFSIIRKLSKALGVDPADVEEFAAAIAQKGKDAA